MFFTQRCPNCKTPLSREVLNGLCPRCMLAAAMDDQLDESTAAWVGLKDGPFVPPSVAELAGQFPQLEITELIGTGGMGAVYRARQPGLDRIVAVKILPTERGRGAEFAERFSREARTLAMLNHPNIVAVYDFGQRDDLCYIVMEYVDGTNLRHQIQTGQIQPAEALRITSQVSGALQYAHEQGVIHRDIKPENILIDLKGRIKIADFGLAKLIKKNASTGHLTRTQQVMGTLRYMAPEQIEKTRDVDHRADIYSLGVVFYELLTRELPLGRFPLPSEKHGLDPRIDDVVLKALNKAPEQRYQHAAELKSDVEAFLQKAHVGLIKPKPATPPWRDLIDWPKVFKYLLIGFGAIILVPLAIGLIPPVFIVAGTVYLAIIFWRWLNQGAKSRPGHAHFVDGVRSIRQSGVPWKVARFVLRNNPITWLFRLVRSRLVWMTAWTMTCIGLYFGFWLPVWDTAAKTSRGIVYYGPGLIEQELWTFEGTVSSSVRLTPTKNLYDSLTVTLDLEGSWDGFNDAKAAMPPEKATRNQYLLKLDANDGKAYTMYVDLAEGASILYKSAAGDVITNSGPVDAKMIRRWLKLTVGDEPGVTDEDLDSHAGAINEILAAGTRNQRYEHIRYLSGPMATVEQQTRGRMARVVSNTATDSSSRDPKARKYPFKDWVGTQTVQIEPTRRILPVGLVVMGVSYWIGILAIRRVIRRRPMGGSVSGSGTEIPSSAA
jgi:predicted Ser/Thr protein kinase